MAFDPAADGLAATPAGVRRQKALLGLLRASGWPGALLLIIVIVAILGPWIAPEDPLHFNSTLLDIPPFTSGHVLGTDNLGRDLLARLLWGAHLSLITALVPVAISGTIGLALGSLVAFGPRWLGFVVMRVADVAFAFPAIMLAIAIAAMLGPSLRNAIIAMVIVLIPPFTRVSRAAALDVSGQPYMAAARLTGASRFRVIRDFALPNMLPPVLVYAATLCGILIIFAAGLSFLGLGVQPPQAEWGRMVADGRQSLLFNPWSSILPGACIFVASMAFNFLGDRWRDYLDPRMR